MATFYNDQAVGSNARIVIAEETTYGTTADSASYVTQLSSEDLQNSINLFESEHIVTNRSVPSVTEGNIRPDGSINCEVYAGSIHGMLVKHALGELDFAKSFTGAGAPLFSTFGSSGGGPTVHYINGGDNLEPMLRSSPDPGATLDAAETAYGLAIERQFTDQSLYILYRGGRIDQWVLTIPTEGPCTSSFRFSTALEADISDSATFAAPTSETNTGTSTNNTDSFTSFETVFSLGTGGSASTLADVGWVRNGSLTVANNLFGDNFVVGQRERANLLPGRRRITGNMTMLFRRKEDYLAFQNSSTYPKYLRITMTKGTGFLRTIFQVDIPYIKFGGSPATPNIAGEGPIEISIPFQSYRPSDSTEEITVMIRNHNYSL